MRASRTLPRGARRAHLHTVAGLSTREIAHAFLVPEATLAQRLVRAKRRIRAAGIPYRVPTEDELPPRLDGVLAVLYLVFSAGYAPSTGDEALRVDLAAEAVRLCRTVLDLVPHDAADEARALLALMLLQHSRHAARLAPDGSPIPFDEQDRARWDADALVEAADLLRAPYRVRGGYRIQAELAAEHALSPGVEATDWARIVALYDELGSFTRSPAAHVSRALALGFAHGWQSGLDELARLEALPSPDLRLLAAARADLLRRSGDRDGAVAAYRIARDLPLTAAERSFYVRRLTELDAAD